MRASNRHFCVSDRSLGEVVDVNSKFQDYTSNVQWTTTGQNVLVGVSEFVQLYATFSRRFVVG